jgi:DNA-binding MarR family transcriptional regulator
MDEATQLVELGLEIKRAQWRHHRELDRRLTALGGSLSQWDAIRAIDRHPGASMHRLAEITFQSDQSFGALTARLISRDFIQRVPGPGRSQHHALTVKGEKLLRDGQIEADQVLAESFATLDSTQRTALLALLNELNGSHDAAA